MRSPSPPPSRRISPASPSRSILSSRPPWASATRFRPTGSTSSGKNPRQAPWRRLPGSRRWRGATPYRPSLAGAAQMFGRIARRFDLSIVRQAEPNKAPLEDLIIEAALFDSGRPVLVVPYIQEGALALDRVMVCWDGGHNAARAVGDAMPFLHRAKAVEVVIVQGDAGKSDEIAGADIGEHLPDYAALHPGYEAASAS